MQDFADLFLYHCLLPTAQVLSYPFYPAVLGLLLCIFRLLRRRYVPGWVVAIVGFLAYFPIGLTAAFILLEKTYSPHDALGSTYMLYAFGVGMLVDFVALPLLIWALWRRHKASAGGKVNE